jgi:hypothetical protein
MVFIHLFIYSFIHLFITYLFIYLFIYSFLLHLIHNSIIIQYDDTITMLAAARVVLLSDVV